MFPLHVDENHFRAVARGAVAWNLEAEQARRTIQARDYKNRAVDRWNPRDV